MRGGPTSCAYNRYKYIKKQHVLTSLPSSCACSLLLIDELALGIENWLPFARACSFLLKSRTTQLPKMIRPTRSAGKRTTYYCGVVINKQRWEFHNLFNSAKVQRFGSLSGLALGFEP